MEYILVLLIVALLNGAIAYIDGLMEGIVPLTLYAEQYMSTLAGVDLFEALFDIVFGFGVSLIILKFLKKGFETYVLWSDGDADEEPIALLTNFFKAMAVAVCFPTMYGWLAGIVEEMSDKMLEAIGLATAYDWAGWVSGISTLGLVTAIFGLVFVIVYFILYFQFLMRGLEILILRVGMPLACVGLIDNDKGVFKGHRSLGGILEMNRLKTVLKDRSGQGTPMILAVVVCCLILACVVFEYMRLVIVAQGVRDSVQSAIVAVATENWDEAYPGLREGYSGGYQLSGSSWTQNVTTGNVYDRLQQVLGLVYEDGRYLKYAGPDLEYRFYDLHMELENAPLAPSVPEGITQLNVTGTVTVEVPLSFGFGHLPPMQITMKLNAKYVPRF